MTWLGFLGIYLIWCVVGFIYFLKNIGNKYGPEPWYAVLLIGPILPIALVFGFIGYLFELYENWRDRRI